MDPAIVERAEREDLAFGHAEAMGASCEPPQGLPHVPSVVEALPGLDAEIFVVVEHDMYPTPFDKPKLIAERTFGHCAGPASADDRRELQSTFRTI